MLARSGAAPVIGRVAKSEGRSGAGKHLGGAVRPTGGLQGQVDRGGGRRAGILVPVALVTLSTGQEFTVEDPGRDVAKRIREARREGADS